MKKILLSFKIVQKRAVLVVAFLLAFVNVGFSQVATCNDKPTISDCFGGTVRVNLHGGGYNTNSTYVLRAKPNTPKICVIDVGATCISSGGYKVYSSMCVEKDIWVDYSISSANRPYQKRTYGEFGITKEKAAQIAYVIKTYPNTFDMNVQNAIWYLTRGAGLNNNSSKHTQGSYNSIVSTAEKKYVLSDADRVTFLHRKNFFDGYSSYYGQNLVSWKLGKVCSVTITNTTNTDAICAGTTKNLIATPSGGTWSIVSGGGSISGNTYMSPSSITTNTQVTIRYTIPSNGSCGVTQSDKTFTVNSNLGVAKNTTNTDAICVGGTKNLTGTPSGGTWSIVSGGGSISGNTYVAPSSITTSTQVTIRYTIPSNGSCGATQSEKTFAVNSNCCKAGNKPPKIKN